MNDIGTAANAMDRPGGGLADLAARSIPEDLRRDDEGRLRIRASSRAFDETAAAIVDQLRPYVPADRNAVVLLVRALATVHTNTPALQRRALLPTHAKALRHAVLRVTDHPRDVELIEPVHGDSVASLGAPRVAARAAAGASG